MPDARMPYRVTPVPLAAIHVEGGSDATQNDTPPIPQTPPVTPLPNDNATEADVPLEYVPDKSVLMPDKTQKPTYTLRASRTTPQAWKVPESQKPESEPTRGVPGAVAWDAIQHNIASTQKPTGTTSRDPQGYDVSLLHRVLSSMGATPPPHDNVVTSKKTRLPPDVDPPDMWEAVVQQPTIRVPTTSKPTARPPQQDGSLEVKTLEALGVPVAPNESGSPQHTPTVHVPAHDDLNKANASLATHLVISSVGEPLHEPVPTTKVSPETSETGSFARNDASQTSGTAQPVGAPASGGSLELLRARVLHENMHRVIPPHSFSEPSPELAAASTESHTPQAVTFTRINLPDTDSTHIPLQTSPDVVEQVVKPSTPPHPTSKTSLPSVHTFRHDVEETITKKRVSVVDVIAAEEKMRTADVLSNTGQTVQRRAHMSPGMYALIGASVTLFVGAAGLLLWYSIARNSVEQVEQGNVYFMTEYTTTYNIAKRNRSAIMRGLTGIRSSLAVGAGSITDVRIVKNDTDAREDAPGQHVTGPEFLSSLNAGISDGFTRALGPNMLLGIHESAANQPFLLLEVAYYENAFASMLAWETSMERDLAPLFSSTAARDATASLSQQDTTQSSTESVPLSAGSTTGSTSPTMVVSIHTDPTPQTSTTTTITGAFGDALLDNTPARVLRDRYGRIRFVWTMPNTKTILITTNEYTVREVKQRLAARQF